MSHYPGTITVNGSGLAAFICAIALKRAFPPATVRIFADTSDFRAEFPGAAAPYIRHFHRQIGLDDRIFVARTGARVVHCIEWHMQGRAATRIYPLSAIPYPEGVAIHHLWRALESPKRPEWAKVAAKFQSDYDRTEGHGIRFDADAYLKLLAEMAAHLKIDVLRSGDADPAAFDLFVDAQAATDPDRKWESSATLVDGANDRVVIENGTALWATIHGTTRFGSVPAAGFSDCSWSGNRLRIGQTALSIETFDGQALCAAMADILRAISLMPARSGSQAEVGEYNRRTSAIHAMLADWHSFKWQGEAGEGSRQMLQQFEHRGRIPFRDEDPVSAAEWTNWLLSNGIVPAQADASALSLSKQQILDILGID